MIYEYVQIYFLSLCLFIAFFLVCTHTHTHLWKYTKSLKQLSLGGGSMGDFNFLPEAYAYFKIYIRYYLFTNI